LKKLDNLPPVFSINTLSDVAVTDPALALLLAFVICYADDTTALVVAADNIMLSLLQILWQTSVKVII
jgi:hypothetical protein